MQIILNFRWWQWIWRNKGSKWYAFNRMVRQKQHGNDGQEMVEGRDTPSITSHYLSFCVAIISLCFPDFSLILPYPTFSSSSSYFLVSDVQLLLCLTVCSPTDFSLQVSSVHRIFQVKTLEWGAISHSRGSSWPRDQIWSPHVSCIGRQILCH